MTKRKRSSQVWAPKKRRRTLAQPLKNAFKSVAKKVIASNAEDKYHTDKSYAGTGISSSGNIWRMSAVVPGDLHYQRDGDQIYATSLTIRYNFIQTDAYNQLRLIIFKWKPYDGTAPTITDVLDNLGYTYVVAPYLRRKGQQYKILYDKTMHLNAQTMNSNESLADTYNNSVSRTISKKIKLGFKIQYEDQLTSGTNNIWCIMVSDSALVPHPHVEYTARLNFRDM